jgi:ATP-dependent Lon protease
MTQLKTWVFASSNDADKLLTPLLTRFTVIHLKPYTKEEFVEIAVHVLNRDERIEKDVAKFIAELVIDKLIPNIRECVRIARLAETITFQRLNKLSKC